MSFGRLKDIIVVGSSNVYPGDVETVLADCGDIREAAVVGRPDAELGEVPVAFVVLETGRRMSCDTVMALFDGKLASYKHPRDIVFIDALPRTALGKVQKSTLREWAKRLTPVPLTLHGSTGGAMGGGRRMAILESHPETMTAVVEGDLPPFVLHDEASIADTVEARLALLHEFEHTAWEIADAGLDEERWSGLRRRVVDLIERGNLSIAATSAPAQTPIRWLQTDAVVVLGRAFGVAHRRLVRVSSG